MTPTEQDKELREQVEKQFDDFIKELRVNTPDGWEIKKYIDLDEVLQLITADRKRVFETNDKAIERIESDE